MMLATVVDTSALAKVVASSLLAGIGITGAFAVAILGATRFADMRREERLAEAVGFAALAIAALAACAAAVVVGIVIMTSK
jgi:hypothetical protein